MPRYLVERTFSDTLPIGSDADGARACLEIVSRNADDGVTWLHSYVAEDGTTTVCVHGAPSPDAISRSARRNDLPVDRTRQVRVLDPYFHHQEEAT